MKAKVVKVDLGFGVDLVFKIGEIWELDRKVLTNEKFPDAKFIMNDNNIVEIVQVGSVTFEVLQDGESV